ncbi:hypothetical protein MRB53_028455 [Persea americana]|uniref:Uncharacterized protein n=1 Tax=Persea americana TaxID=3435 RepID=A0ACC2KFX3_PERAE|nr:hypothetical protein MRB53_028455 [Persea americana]
MEKNPASGMERFITSLHCKIHKIKIAFGGAFDQYVETCSSSQLDEEKEMVVTPKQAVWKKPASKSPTKKKKGRMPHPLMIDDSPIKPSSLKSRVEEPKIPVSLDPHILLDEDFNLIPIEELFSTLLCHEMYTTPPPNEERAIPTTPSPTTTESLVWRIKHLPKTQRVPNRLLDFLHSIT